MNKKLIKTIASITCGLGVATTIPFIVSSCGRNEQLIQISYTDGASKDFGVVNCNSTSQSAGEIIADVSLENATWHFNATCLDDSSLTPIWNEFLTFQVDNDTKKISVTTKYPSEVPGKPDYRFSFSLYGKIDGKKTSTISGFTLQWRC